MGFSKTIHSALKASLKKDAKNPKSSSLGLVHYSHVPDLKTIDPKFKGSGVDSKVKGRDTSHPHSFFYRDNTDPEEIVVSRAPYRYTGQIDTEKNKLYDLGSDPQKLIARAKSRNQGVLDMDLVHEEVKNSGHAGFFNSNHPNLKNVVAMYGPVDVSIDSKYKKTEDMEKNTLRNIGAGLAIAGALATGTPEKADAPTVPKTKISQAATKTPTAPKATAEPKAATPKFGDEYSTKRMLHTIAQVESSGGRNINHAPVNSPMHRGNRAYGQYGLMPVTIKDTIKAHGDLKSKHGKALALDGQDFHNYMKRNPELGETVAERHVQRLERQFGQDPSKIGYAWFQGIRGTHDAIKQKKDIENHWHVKKIRDAYKRGNK